MIPDPEEFESFEEMADTTAIGLDQAASSHAFRLYNNRKFRRLVNFDKQSQVEQDRIFNELVVAFVVMTMLLLEAPDLRVPEEFKEYLGLLHQRIPKAHIDCLRELGIQDEYLSDWGKLIDMRYQEYAKDRHEVRAAAMELKAADDELELRDLQKIQMLVPVQSTAIGCHHHVCKDETDGRDDLFKMTLGSLSEFYVKIRVGLEGGKIGPLTRARAVVKHMVRRHRDKKRKR
jgi:hypothetical protein